MFLAVAGAVASTFCMVRQQFIPTVVCPALLAVGRLAVPLGHVNQAVLVRPLWVTLAALVLQQPVAVAGAREP